jgi:hypothetical protein
MLKIDLKEEVRKVIGGQWSEFAQRHPRLAEVIDRDLLVEQAVTEISRDPRYRSAMEGAATAGTLAQNAARFIEKYVLELLRRLV